MQSYVFTKKLRDLVFSVLACSAISTALIAEEPTFYHHQNIMHNEEVTVETTETTDLLMKLLQLTALYYTTGITVGAGCLGDLRGVGLGLASGLCVTLIHDLCKSTQLTTKTTVRTDGELVSKTTVTKNSTGIAPKRLVRNFAITAFVHAIFGISGLVSAVKSGRKIC